ncbi:hypothetical protein [Streptomyces sp. NPDC006996]|uniref:hypothetical protein n=1 Tax=Streptomyces sp. NPDC006996 TaxID=3156908 RepID=UPI0033C144B2
MSTAAVWALAVGTTQGIGPCPHTVARVRARAEGAREAAPAELERQARGHVAEHPGRPRLLRTAEGFLLVVEGAWQTFGSRFTVRELPADPRPAARPGAGGRATRPAAARTRGRSGGTGVRSGRGGRGRRPGTAGPGRTGLS